MVARPSRARSLSLDEWMLVQTASCASSDKGGMHGGKTVFKRIIDRNLRQVRAQVAPNITREALQNVVLKNTNCGTKVYSRICQMRSITCTTVIRDSLPLKSAGLHFVKFFRYIST